jgi:hypothetical protein
LAYWKRNVEDIQRGEARAEYGKQVINSYQNRLNKRYGKGFSTTNLWYFRQFYVVYSKRKPEILHKSCGESDELLKLHKACGVLDDMSLAVEKANLFKVFLLH